MYSAMAAVLGAIHILIFYPYLFQLPLLKTVGTYSVMYFRTPLNLGAQLGVLPSEKNVMPHLASFTFL